MNQPKTYTRLTAEVRYYDGDELKQTVETNAWACDIYQMGEMIKQLLLAMGFHPNTVDLLFENGEAVEPIDYNGGDNDDNDDNDDLCCSNTDDDEVLYVTGDYDGPNDPCCCCDVACEDTACLNDTED